MILVRRQGEVESRLSLKTQGEGSMATRLEQAFAEAAKLPLQEQEALADWILDELQSEKRWGQLFANSQDVLSILAAEALDEHHRGETQDLDPEQL